MEIDINVRKLNTLTTYITHSTIVRGYVSVSPKLDTLNSRANLNRNLAGLKQLSYPFFDNYDLLMNCRKSIQ